MEFPINLCLSEYFGKDLRKYLDISLKALNAEFVV